MASLVCENLALINGDDEARGMELLEINGALLMSLMEESPSDEGDDDRLDGLIRSLEAEINGCDSTSMGSELVSRGNIGQVDGQEYWDTCDFEMEWVNMDVMPSSTGDDGSWRIGPYVDEIDGITEFLDICNNLEMNDGYNSFWTESYDSVMCD